MKIDFDQVLKGFDSQDLKFKENDQAPEEPFRLKTAAFLVLRNQIEGDQNLDHLKKYELGVIGKAIGKGLDLTTEQLSTLKERIGKAPFFNAEVVAGAFDAIEGG